MDLRKIIRDRLQTVSDQVERQLDKKTLGQLQEEGNPLAVYLESKPLDDPTIMNFLKQITSNTSIQLLPYVYWEHMPPFQVNSPQGVEQINPGDLHLEIHADQNAQNYANLGPRERFEKISAEVQQIVSDLIQASQTQANPQLKQLADVPIMGVSPLVRAIESLIPRQEIEGLTWKLPENFKFLDVILRRANIRSQEFGGEGQATRQKLRLLYATARQLNEALIAGKVRREKIVQRENNRE